MLKKALNENIMAMTAQSTYLKFFFGEIYMEP
jgi:hypothetical protein